MRILPQLVLALAIGAVDLVAQTPGGPPPRTPRDDTSVAESRLAIVHATIESPAGNRFCVGNRNTLVVEIRRRGGTPRAPAIVTMSQVRDQGVEIVPIPDDQLVSGGPISVRIEGVAIDPGLRESGIITLAVREAAGTGVESGGKGLDISVARRTAWDTPCDRP